MINLSQYLYSKYQQVVDANNAAREYSQKGNFTEATHYINIALKHMGLQKPLIDDTYEIEVLRLFRYIYGFAGYVYGNAGYNDLSLQCYQNAWYLRFQVTTPFDNENCIKLYQFRSYSKEKTYAVDNLRQYQISLAPTQEQNDVVDCPAFAYKDYCLDYSQKYNKHLPMLEKSFKGVRISSFCTDSNRRKAVKNPLMWAHYADSHSGFCVEYSLDKSMFRINDPLRPCVSRMLKVDYKSPKKMPLDFSNTDTISIQNGFFCKSVDWSYEHEVRIVQYSPTEIGSYSIIPLRGDSRIKAIYFGIKCPKETIDEVKDALQGRNVKYYQMRINIKNIQTLTYNEI